MFLITPHEMNKLTRGDSTSIRQVAEDDLDERMRAILNDRGLSLYEKVKRYEALLHRFLTLAKQGQNDERQITLQLPAPEPVQLKQSGAVVQGDENVQENEQALNELVKNLPLRAHKNARYIMLKLSEANADWTSRGEFVYRGNVVKGSHIADLFRNLTLTYKKPQSPPKGWTIFLNTLAEVNIPTSMLSNRHARQQYSRLKTATEGNVIEAIEDDPRGEKTPRRPRRRVNLSPRWMTLE